MAHGLKQVRMHQALHGYSDGHRLLACSITLKSKEQKTMLVMSDVSGSGAVIDETGYLTGYPLPESGFYALARTWPAIELPRPGCVWTHTLLIDFADLALTPAMDAILSSFRRPGAPDALSGYYNTTNIDDLTLFPTRPIDSSQRELLRRLLWALYEHPNERVVAEKSASIEDSALAIWSQQWPRLRRTFRFCTLAFDDRSAEGEAFDLQFFPARDSAVRSRFVTATDANRLNPPSLRWLEDAVLDLSRGGSGQLRFFLRQVGGDVAGGREAFVPLCRLHGLLKDFETSPDSADEAVTLIEAAFEDKSAKSVRAVLTSAAAQSAERLSDHSLDFVMEHIDLLTTEQFESSSSRLGAELWRRGPGLAIRLLEKKPRPAAIAEQLVAGLPSGELVKALRSISGMEARVLACRPDLLTEPEFWTLGGSWQDEGLDLAAREPGRGASTLAAMITANRPDLAPAAARIFGSAGLLRAIDDWLCQRSREDSQVASVWLDSALREPVDVAQSLSHRVVQYRATLVAIAHQTYPDFVPNDFGEDPWWSAAHDARGELSKRSTDYLCSYLMARALGYRSRNQAELLTYAFDYVYFAALRSQLADEAWRLLDPRLPSAGWFFDWDRCRRIRAAIVAAFVDRELSPSMFAQITEDDDAFAELADLAADSRTGRRFLRKVRDVLLKPDSSESRRRVSIVENLI